VALAIRDRVLAVVEDAIEPFVEMGHVITTIEIVVDKHLPVAVEGVTAAFHPLEAFKAERVELTHEIQPEELM